MTSSDAPADLALLLELRSTERHSKTSDITRMHVAAGAEQRCLHGPAMHDDVKHGLGTCLSPPCLLDERLGWLSSPEALSRWSSFPPVVSAEGCSRGPPLLGWLLRRLSREDRGLYKLSELLLSSRGAPSCSPMMTVPALPSGRPGISQIPCAGRHVSQHQEMCSFQSPLL